MPMLPVQSYSLLSGHYPPINLALMLEKAELVDPFERRLKNVASMQGSGIQR